MKKILNERGISIVQTLIAAAMAGGLSLVIARLMIDSKQSVKTAQVQTDFIKIYNDIHRTMSNEASCTLTFAEAGEPEITSGPTYTVPATAGETGFTHRIRKCRGGTSLVVDHLRACSNSVYTNKNDCEINNAIWSPSVTTWSCTEDIHAPGANKDDWTRRFLYDDKTDYLGGVFDIEYKYSYGASSSTLREIEFEVSFVETALSKARKTIKRSANYKKSFKLLVEVNGADEIIRCVSVHNGLMDIAISRSCQGDGVELVPTGSGGTYCRRKPMTERIAVAGDTGFIECGDNQYSAGLRVVEGKLVNVCKDILGSTSTCSQGEYLTASGGCTAITQSDGSPCPTGSGSKTYQVNYDAGLQRLICKPFDPGCRGVLVNDPATGLFQCLSCTTAGNVLAKTTNGYECVPVRCNDDRQAGNSGQQYYYGMNPDGTPVCRGLVRSAAEGQDYCASGASTGGTGTGNGTQIMSVMSDGRVRLECP